ncbi:MAG: hypothetical protein WC606_05680 [Candidatus Absconditabacterales bacterium]|jgi:hypothetical protein
MKKKIVGIMFILLISSSITNARTMEALSSPIEDSISNARKELAKWDSLETIWTKELAGFKKKQEVIKLFKSSVELSELEKSTIEETLQTVDTIIKILEYRVQTAQQLQLNLKKLLNNLEEMKKIERQIEENEKMRFGKEYEMIDESGKG